MEFSILPWLLKHIKGSSNSTADSLSRLPVCTPGSASAPFPNVQNATNMSLPQSMTQPSVNKVDISVEDCKIMGNVQYLARYPGKDVASVTIHQIVGDRPVAVWDILPLTTKDVADATKTDKVYGKLFRADRSGVLNTKDKDISKFNGVFDQLYTEDDVIHLGNRVVIHTRHHNRLLEELHYSHIGVVKMKQVVRDYFWWPGITKDIETIAAKCEVAGNIKINLLLILYQYGHSLVCLWKGRISIF